MTDDMNNTVDYDIFDCGDLPLLHGGSLQQAKLAYKTYGSLSANADNVVLMPTFFTGTHKRNEGFFGRGRALDPARHFIISVNLFGNGLSTSPSNASVGQKAKQFPLITFQDNVRAQHTLLTNQFGITRIALVLGWSMAGCQAYHWAVQYPAMVQAILPICASARTSTHNFVFLEGVKAALCADSQWNNGNYQAPPVAGLRAFGRAYAGWAFSYAFYRDKLYEQLGFSNVGALLDSWAEEHVTDWDANNLLAKLATWQAGDISSATACKGDVVAALQSIEARAILMPCNQDMYFRTEDNMFEAKHMPHAECRPYDSPWGHCAANPGNDHGFATSMDSYIGELLGE